jgi:cytochrome c553
VRSLCVVVLLCLAGVGCSAGRAEDALPAAAARCTVCHALPGHATSPMYPVLAGQHAEYLASQMRAFRDKTRANPIMNMQAAGLSDSEIAELAKYYEQAGRAPGSGLLGPR